MISEKHDVLLSIYVDIDVFFLVNISPRGDLPIEPSSSEHKDSGTPPVSSAKGWQIDVFCGVCVGGSVYGEWVPGSPCGGL